MHCQLLLLIALLVMSAAPHELCLDMSGPKATQMDYCTMYNPGGKSCCNTTQDADIKSLMIHLAIPYDFTDCPSLMQNLLCAECDPWSAHLFGQEVNPYGQAPPPVAHMCNDFCGRFYQSCAHKPMQWPEWMTPYFTTSVIADTYPTISAFCAVFGEQKGNQYCFGGEPYVPESLRPFDPNTEEICVERWSFNQWEPMFLQLQDPNDGTDRVFLARKDGVIQVYTRSTGQYQSDFMTIPNVFSDGEAGFTGLVFHPNYKSNGRFFVHYACTMQACAVPCNNATPDAESSCNTGLSPACSSIGYCNGDHVSVVAEFRVSSSDPNKGDLTSRRVILAQTQPFRIHNAGSMLFGPDGLFYMAFGDGGNFNDPNNRAQSLTTVLGKVIRLDLDSTPPAGATYAIPPTNPFVGTAGAMGEVWAYGLRNPWRCAFHPGGVEKGLLCGDVGQDLVEELNVVKAGQNYGWRFYEGRNRAALYINDTAPNDITWAAIEYTHEWMHGGSAVIGGHFYSNSGSNTCFRGRYLWADHDGILWVSSEDASGDYSFARLRPLCATNSAACATDLGNIFSFGQDSNGESYILGSAAIYRVVPQSRCSLQCGSTEAYPQGGGPIAVYGTGYGGGTTGPYQTGYWTTSGSTLAPITTADTTTGGSGTSGNDATSTTTTTTGGSTTGTTGSATDTTGSSSETNTSSGMGTTTGSATQEATTGGVPTQGQHQSTASIISCALGAILITFVYILF